MTDAERAIFSAARARELCLSLERAFVGPTAIARLRAGETTALRPRELEIALGLAWAAGEIELIRQALSSLPTNRIDDDPVLATFRDVTR